MFAPETAIGRRLPASIEILPSQTPTPDQLAALLPTGTRVHLADIGTQDIEAEMLTAARNVREAGCIPVPHFAARRIISRQALETRLGHLAEHAGVNDVLVVGGSTGTPVGPYSSALDILETGLFDRLGIEDIAVAGHPEGSPDFTEASAMQALRLKQAFAHRSGVRLRIVTQFGFDPARAVAWSQSLLGLGVDLPVHVGVAGPTNFAALMKYARLCGVGSSLSLLKKRGGNMLSLTTGYAPDAVVASIEEQLSTLQRPAMSQMHVFPFGGLLRASSWLRQRGSW